MNVRVVIERGGTRVSYLHTDTEDVDKFQRGLSHLTGIVPLDATWYCIPVDDGASLRDELPQPKENLMADDFGKLLSEPFPKEILGTLTKGGTRLTYVPVAEVIVRLNEVLGVGNWGSEVINAYRDTIDPDWIVAHVRLRVEVAGKLASFDGFGGQKIKRTSKEPQDPVDLGDEFKGAVSDALKKAAQQLGVGLELARKDEALRYQEERDAAAADPPAPKEDLDRLRADIDRLSGDTKDAFRAWWKDNDLPKPQNLPTSKYVAVRAALDGYLARVGLEPTDGPGAATAGADEAVAGEDKNPEPPEWSPPEGWTPESEPDF